MPVYLDHAATSPMPPAVREAYLDALAVVGNPSSIHTQGQRARQALEEAREAIAITLGADPVELVFTSGGTESVNLGIKGLYWQRQVGRSRPVILMPEGEHHATLDSAQWLAAHEEAQLRRLPVDARGVLLPETLAAALADVGEDAALLTMLWANNEVGTIQPVSELVDVAARAGVPTHVDAVAALGYLPIDFDETRAAALSVSAHKIGGPVGIGALLLSRGSEVTPLIHGGNQQRARSGTLDVAGAVAFAAAATEAQQRLAEIGRLSALRDTLISGVRSAVPQAVLRGAEPGSARLPGNAHFTFPGCEGDSLLMMLDMAGFSVSTGSACQAGVPELSHVLLGLGVSEQDARGALRVTLGFESTRDEVEAFVAALPSAYESARRAGLSSRPV